MGNVCGCVRFPKEECYVDPKKAPLRPESKELKGHRYFQRKKRKSDFLQPVEPLNNPGCEAATSETVSISREPQNDPDWNAEEETHLSRQESLSRGFNVGEAPVFIVRASQHQPQQEITPKISTDSDSSRSTVDKRLHDINTTSRVAPGREGLLAKELMRHQLSRSASFGVVEHTLHVLRFSDRPRNEETSAKIIWGCQANRTRRASSCSGYIQHYPVPADYKVNL